MRLDPKQLLRNIPVVNDTSERIYLPGEAADSQGVNHGLSHAQFTGFIVKFAKEHFGDNDTIKAGEWVPALREELGTTGKPDLAMIDAISARWDAASYDNEITLGTQKYLDDVMVACSTGEHWSEAVVAAVNKIQLKIREELAYKALTATTHGEASRVLKLWEALTGPTLRRMRAQGLVAPELPGDVEQTVVGESQAPSLDLAGQSV